MQARSNDASIYVYRAAMIILDAQPGLHVSPITEIYIASRHMWGNRFGVPGGWVVLDAERV
jgi:hypothetical protein